MQAGQGCRAGLRTGLLPGARLLCETGLLCAGLLQACCMQACCMQAPGRLQLPDGCLLRWRMVG